MVIACNKCQTRFHVDDARVPDSGVKVRCSRCKHAFYVRKPDARPDAEIHAAAAAALESSAPEPSLDLAGSTEPPPRSAPREDEDEWQFAVDPPDAAASRAPEPEPVPEAGAVPSAPTEQVSLNDRAKELRAAAKLADTESSSLADLASPESWDLVAGNDGALAPHTSATSAVSPGSPVSPASPEEPALALGHSEPEAEVDPEPEDWEAEFGGGSIAASSAESPAARSAALDPALARASQATGSALDDDEAPASRSPRKPRSARREEAHESPFEAPVGVGAAVRSAAWVGLVGLVLLLGIGLVRTQPIPGTGSTGARATLAVAGLEARGVEARWIENRLAGSLLVVSGSLVNPGSDAVLPEGAVRVTLLDAAAQPLDGGAFAGLPVEEDRLRRAEPEALAAELRHSAARLARRRVAPGEVVPFQAVLPDSLRAASLRLERVAAPPLPRPPAAAETSEGLGGPGSGPSDAPGEAAASADGTATAS